MYSFPGSSLKGRMVERWVAKRLCENGIKCKNMPPNHPFDILTDSGTKIEVKSAHVRNGLNGCYRFNLRATQHENCDFYCFALVPLIDVFVVNKSEIESLGVNGVYIGYLGNGKRARKTRIDWSKARNNFQIISNFKG